MKIIPQALPDDANGIVTVRQVIKVVEDDDDDSSSEGALQAGVYCQDSLGQVWILHAAATELFAAFDMNDPQLRRERVETRDRFKKAQKDMSKRKQRKEPKEPA